MTERTRLLTPSPLRRAVQLLWTTPVAVFNEFVLTDLREGQMELHGLGWVSRQLIRLGLAVNLGMLLVLLNAERLRHAFDLRPALVLTPGRGALIPTILFPLSLFLLSLAWSYALTGAGSAHRLVRTGILVLYLFTATASLTLIVFRSQFSVWIGLTLLLLLCLIYTLAPRRWLPPERLFALLLLIVGGLFALAQARALASDRLLGSPLGEAALQSNLAALGTLVLPLLMLAGFDIAGFALRAATWTTALTERLLPFRWLTIIAGLGTLLLAYSIARHSAEPTSATNWLDLLMGLAGALILVLVMLAFWRLVDLVAHGQGTRNAEALGIAAARCTMPLVLCLLFPLLLSFIPTQLAQIVQPLALQFGGAWQPVGAVLYGGASLLMTVIQQRIDTWYLLVSVGLLAFAIYALTSHRPALALYTGFTAIRSLWVHLTTDNGPLLMLGWESQDLIVLVWLLVTVATALMWWRRGPWRPAHTVRLLFIVILLALVRQTDFIGDPFSPFLPFTAIGFIAFGLAWNMLTAGGWTNQSDRWLPSASRLFLYVGYMMLTITLVNWAVTAHDLTTVNRFTGETGLAGFFVLGVPFIYALIPVTLFAPWPPAEAAA
jgi:hypothetical protein